MTGKAEWQKPVTKDRSEVLSWLGIGKRGASHAREQSKATRTFESIGDEWREDLLPYAIAFYAGLRRSEIHRLEWPDVLAGRTIALSLGVVERQPSARAD